VNVALDIMDAEVTDVPLPLTPRLALDMP